MSFVMYNLNWKIHKLGANHQQGLQRCRDDSETGFKNFFDDELKFRFSDIKTLLALLALL